VAFWDALAMAITEGVGALIGRSLQRRRGRGCLDTGAGLVYQPAPN